MEHLRILGLSSLERKGLRSNLTALCSFPRRGSREGGADLFSLACSDRLSESRDHSTVSVGRDLWRSPVKPLLKHSAQNRVQAGFECLQRRRLHQLSGQPVPVLCHPQGKDVFPPIPMELPGFAFVPVAPCAGGNGTELCQGRSRLEVRKHFFAERVVKHRNRLPRELLDAPSLSLLKRSLESAPNNTP